MVTKAARTYHSCLSALKLSEVATSDTSNNASVCVCVLVAFPWPDAPTGHVFSKVFSMPKEAITVHGTCQALIRQALMSSEENQVFMGSPFTRGHTRKLHTAGTCS